MDNGMNREPDYGYFNSETAYDTGRMNNAAGQMNPTAYSAQQEHNSQSFPDFQDIHCYGTNSQKYADILMEFINDEYHDSLYYAALANRARSNNERRIFRQMSHDEYSHSRKFAAAYFLITGKRYLPSAGSTEPVDVPASYNQALRDRYLAETRDIYKYRNFAVQTDDACLKELALKTSEDERQHSQLILDILENMKFRG